MIANDDEVPESRISLKQERAIAALLTEPSLAKAAETAGVGVRSLTRWLSQPEFKRAFREARKVAFMQAIALTQRYTPLAVHTLAKVMNDPAAPYAAKVSAAAAILKFGRESIELDDLAHRIEALEADQRDRDQEGKPRDSWAA
ncbi:MAG: hypothetical protein IT436_13460 [Phycisphaerales bacterium]|nr:hypothetical protein [Phycisphaerales bacterium]